MKKKHAVLATIILLSCHQPVTNKTLSGNNTGLLQQDSALFTPANVQEQVKYARAMEAVIWGIPLVNFDAMRQAYLHDAGAAYNDVIYFSKPADWKFQVTTPNNSTNYVMFFSNLKEGPVVVDIPPAQESALFGSLIDAWNSPLIDVGGDGEDKGKGGKYILLPPGYREKVPAGYFTIQSQTFNIYSLLRVIPKSNSKTDVDNAIAYLHKLKIYPLSKPSQSIKYIDTYDKTFEAIVPTGIDFYKSLSRMINEEPIKQRDLNNMGLLYSIGIRKDSSFNPDAASSVIFKAAASEAHKYLMNGFAEDGFTWWQGRQWKFLTSKDFLATHATAEMPDRILIDDRAFVFFGAFGGVRNPPPNLYVKVHRDKNGDLLNGSSTYRLHVPANVPTTQFWAVVAYDDETAGFIRNAAVVGLDSYNQQLKKNSDGSIDLYLSSKAPAGMESNWISTTNGRPFFLLFRNYAPQAGVLQRTSSWTLDDLEKVTK